MNRIKSFAGSALAGLALLGTCAAQAATRTWTGASAENKNWTTAENWSDNTAPTASDTAKIGTADIVIDVEGSDESNPAVGALTVDPNAKITLTGQKRLYTGTSNTSIGQAAEITIQGIDNPFVPEGKDPDITNASVIVRGSQNTLATKANVTVSGKGSRFEVQKLSLNASSVNTFTANNGGLIQFTPYKTESKSLTLTLNSDNGGFDWPKNGTAQLTINGGKLTLNLNTASSLFQGFSIGGGAVVFDLKDTTVKFGGFTTSASGSSIKLDNSGFKTDWGFTYGNSYDSPIEMRGANPYIQATNGGLDIKANVTVTLVPELTWDEKATPLFNHAGTKGNVYFRDGWKCTVDVSKFAHYYGKKMVVFARSLPTVSTTRNFYLPAVTVVGEGAENCKVTFSRDKAYNTSNYMYMTIESQNPPVGSVARILRNGTKYYYNSLEDAFAAAQANDTISPIANVSLKNSVTVSQAVTLDPNTFCVSGDDLTSAPFKVTGGALTIKGTGAINGGTNTAVCVTGGSFASPADSTVTFSSTNDTIVISADVTADIDGGTFMSENGQPVNSAINRILRGGLYNKEPALALIAEDYTTEKVGDLWEVVLDGEPICKVGDRTFASLEKAYAVVPNYGDIFIVADAIVPPLTLNRKIDVGIDVSGHTLTPFEGNTLFIVDGDTLHLWDNPESGPTGSFNGGVVLNSGTLEIDTEVTINAEPALTVNSGTANKVFGTINGGVVLNGGTLKMNATVNAVGVAIAANGGTLNVSGGSYTGGTSAFAAGEKFTGTGIISTGSFSSAIDVKYLSANSMLKQVGDRYEVVFADVTYTWKGGVSGDWANPDNWTPSKTPCFGIPNNIKATAKFASASDNIVVNLGGGNYQIGTFIYSHYSRQTLTNGAIRLSKDCLGDDRRLILEDVEATVVDPVLSTSFDFNLQLDGRVRIVGDLAPNSSMGLKKSWNSYDCLYIAKGSNEVTGVIHNRNTQLDVRVVGNATLVAGEIKADSNTSSLPLNVSLAKGATMKVGKIAAADVAGKFAFTFNATAAGFASAPVSFAKNTDNVALDDKTAITVNIDEGFASGSIPLFSGVGLSAESQPVVTVNIAGKTAQDISRMKIRLRERNGVICLDIRPQALVITIQ